MKRDTWRSLLAIYLIIGVLALVACVSIAISNQGEAESEIETEIDASHNLDIGEDDAS